MKDRFKSLGFTASHVHLLIVVVAFFSVMIVAKSGINFRAMFANADDEQVMLTYDSVRSEVEAEFGYTASGEDKVAEQQIALLDRKENGQVLGEAIGLGAIPSAEQMFSKENLETLPIDSIIPTDSVTAEKYFNNLKIVESYFDSTNILALLNSNDEAQLTEASEQAKNIVRSLRSVPVPNEFTTFHRYQMLYYTSLSQLAENFTSNDYGVSFQETSKAMFSLTDRIVSLKSEFANKYNLSL